MENINVQEIGRLVKKDLDSKEYKTKFTHNQKKILIAYAQSSCNISEACKRAKLSRMSWHNYVKIPDFKEYAESIQEMDLDFAEGQLRFLMRGQYTIRVDDKGKPVLDAEGQPIRDYINPIDTTSVIFKLKTHGKNRGYTQRLEHTGAEGQPLGGFKITIKKKK